MLEDVFADLYKEGVLFFLNTTNYLENTVDTNIFDSRKVFLKTYDRAIAVGWLFVKTDTNDVIEELKNDCCAIVRYGWDSDTDEKAANLGKLFVTLLVKHNFIPPSLEDKVILKIGSEQHLDVVITLSDVDVDTSLLVDLVR